MIRKANNKDLNQIISLINEHYKKYNDNINLNYYDKDLQNIEKNYFQKKGYFWVAIIKKEIIGTIAIIPENNNSVQIKRIYVKPDLHGTEVGRNLLKRAFEFALDKKIENIFLWSDKRYKRAHNFFIKNKFSIVTEKDFFDADNPYRSILFEKKII